MAAMGRVLGIPSRVAVGFLNGETQPDGSLLYTSDDRHAWPEMYFTGVGWVRFEPTPGQRAGATPAWTRQDINTADPTEAPSSSPAPARGADAQAEAEDDQGSGDALAVPWWPAAALGLVVLVGVAPGVVRRAQRRRRLAGDDPDVLAEGAWAELRATAVDLGLDWPEQRSPREQAHRVLAQVGEPEAEDVTSPRGVARAGRAGPLRTDGRRRDDGPRGALTDGGDGRVVASGDAGQRRPGARLAWPALAGLGAAAEEPVAGQ